MIIIIIEHFYSALKCKQTQSASHCTTATRRKTGVRQNAEAFLSLLHGSLQNSHRVISISANTSIVLNCALPT